MTDAEKEQYRKDWDADVQDCKNSFKNAEKELTDAQNWRDKMLVQYAESILLRQKRLKDL